MSNNPKSSGQQSATPPKLFQRQMTASQLLSTTCSPTSSCQPDPLTNKQRAAALLASARGELPQAGQQQQTYNLANSTTCLSNRKSEFEQQQQQNKKPVKNKRIISRMLSISAIHTSALGGSSNSSNNNNSNGSNNNIGLEQQIATSGSNCGSELFDPAAAAASMTTMTSTATTLADQVPGETSIPSVPRQPPLCRYVTFIFIYFDFYEPCF